MYLTQEASLNSTAVNPAEKLIFNNYYLTS